MNVGALLWSSAVTALSSVLQPVSFSTRAGIWDLYIQHWEHKCISRTYLSMIVFEIIHHCQFESTMHITHRLPAGHGHGNKLSMHKIWTNEWIGLNTERIFVLLTVYCRVHRLNKELLCDNTINKTTLKWKCIWHTFSPVNGGPEGAGGNQLTSATVHGQNHPVHPGPQPFNPGDQKLAVTQLEWDSFSDSENEDHSSCLVRTCKSSQDLVQESGGRQSLSWKQGRINRLASPPAVCGRKETSLVILHRTKEPVLAGWLQDILLWLFNSIYPVLFLFCLCCELVTVTILISCRQNWWFLARSIQHALRIDKVSWCSTLDIM